jgi:hypothetical protein
MARFELEDGRSELASHTGSGAYKAIKSFHDALETFALALTDHAGLPRAHRTLAQHLGELEKKTGQQFKHRYVVGLVGDLRDPAKHQALAPNAEAVADISARLDPVFDDNALNYLEVSFFNVRLADTIRHEHAKRELTAAEDANAHRQYGEVLGFARAGFEMFMLDQRTPTEHALSDHLISDRVERLALKASPELPHELRSINERWQKLNDRFRLLELGINLAVYDRFKAVTPRVFIPGDRTRRQISESHGEPLHATPENSSFALMFALETIRRIEDQWPRAKRA